MIEYWNPCKEKLPENWTFCFVIFEGGSVDTSTYNAVQDDWKPSDARKVVFWRKFEEVMNE